MSDNNIPITYTERTYLMTRGAVNQLPPDDVDGTLLVGNRIIARWDDRHSQYGHDDVTVRPAFHNGVRAFFVTRDWCPAHGYCAEGISNVVYTLEEGVKLLIEHSYFDALFPEPGR